MSTIKQQLNDRLGCFLLFLAVLGGLLLVVPRSSAITGRQGSEYSVSEDELALFATLAYETPSPVGTASLKVGTKSTTYRAHDYKRLHERVKCAEENVKANFNGDKNSCLRSDNPENTQYRYTLDDLVGIDYEAILLKDIKKQGTVNVLANTGGIAMAAIIGREAGSGFYFSDLVDLDNQELLKGWEVVDFKEEAAFSVSDNYGLMSVVTFKKGNDVVIAYRGTDFTDLVDWLGVDGSYAIKNNSQQDKAAIDYARYIGEVYNGDGKGKYNIYVTGHSLGGYLSQIAGAGLLGSLDSRFQNQLNADNTVDNPYNLKRIVYFNGMGLFFSQKSMVNIANNQKILSDRLRSFNTNEDGAMGDRVLLVRMLGDLVSSIGVHYGQIKTMSADKRLVEKHNNELLSLHRLGNQMLEKVFSTSEVKKLTTTGKEWSNYTKEVIGKNISASLDRILANFVNISVKEVAQEITNKDKAGTPYKGLLPYVMSTHETDSFFATNYYTDGSDVDSIDSVGYSKREDVSINWANYDSPFCVFQSDYLPQDNNYKFETRYYKVLKAGAGEILTGSIICSSPNGFSDKTISLGDISYTANVKANLIGMKIEDGTADVEGKRVIPGDDRVLSWDVQIFFPRVGLLKKTVIPGAVKSLSLKSGAVKDKLGRSNNQAFFPYLLVATNLKTEALTYTGKNNKINTPAEKISGNITNCQFSVKKDVKTRLLLNPTYDGLIACQSDELSNATIYDSDLDVSPSNRLKDVVVDFSGKTKLSNGQYRYSWKVKFKGVWSNPGPVKITLRSGAIKDKFGRFNLSLQSNLIEVSR